MASESILVVEDSIASSRLFCLLLSKAGYNVRSAPNADKALEALQEFRPDLILLDILLPGLDGFSLARQIKSSAGTSGTSIVVLSACSLSTDIERALDCGCSGYISKPIDTKTFVSVVRSHLLRRAGQMAALSGPETAPAQR